MGVLRLGRTPSLSMTARSKRKGCPGFRGNLPSNYVPVVYAIVKEQNGRGEFPLLPSTFRLAKERGLSRSGRDLYFWVGAKRGKNVARVVVRKVMKWERWSLRHRAGNMVGIPG